MKKIISVGVGGALGSLCRHFVQSIPLQGGTLYRPILTMGINISGSFLLGFLIILFTKHFSVPDWLRAGLTAGVLGGYTTFSTFCKEAVTLYNAGHIVFAALYLSGSLLLGLAAAWLGILAAERIKRGAAE